MPREAYEIIDGTHVPVTPSGSVPPGPPEQESAPVRQETGTPGVAPGLPAEGQEPAGAPPASPEPSPSPGETEEGDEPEDTQAVTLDDFNRHMARLRRRQRKAERDLAAERQQHALELAQTRGQLDMVQRLLSGQAPTLPEPTPTGPPQPEQFASHDAYVQATARHEAQQALAHEREQRLASEFQQSLIAREQTFKQAHPDYDAVVRAGLAGKVAPHVQQALMVLPDGPAVAYALATQADLVARLNTLAPPLVFAELGRLAPAPPAATNGTAAPPAPPRLPAPPTPLSGSSAGTPTGGYHEGMSQAEYRQWRARTSELPAWKKRA